MAGGMGEANCELFEAMTAARLVASGRVSDTDRMDDADDQAIRDGSDLCTHCGLCCDGTLFVRMLIEPEEIAAATRAGLEIVVGEGAARGSLPCPSLKDRCCTIYPARYAVCRRYRCMLLGRLRAGAVDRATAFARVAEAQRMRTAARSAAILAGTPDFSIAAHRRPGVGPLPRDPEARRVTAAAHLAGAALALYLAKHFHAGRAEDKASSG